jgi:CRP/FNR family cyclic AMP-dependent transcriptional regulator
MKVAPVFPHIQKALLALSRPRVEPAGAVLFRRNEPSFGIFLVRKGRVSLRLEGEGTAVLVDRRAGPGSIVGLPATLSGSRYSLTAVTLERCKISYIERKTLLAAIRKNAELAMELLQAMSEEVIAMREVLAAAPRHR